MNNTIIDLVYSIRYLCTENDNSLRQKTPLSPSEYRALMSLDTGEEISAAGFSRRLGLSPSRGSRVIDKMSENGFIKRNSVKGDRRSIRISLALEGIVLKEQIVAMMNDCELKIREKLTPKEYSEAESVLKRVVEVLVDLNE